MRYILFILLASIIVSCQVLTATTSTVVGSAACNSSEKKRTFPEEGSKNNIDLSFTIIDEGNEIIFSERAVCEYKGSICGGGAWFEVWHGDQSIAFNIPLSSGDELIFSPHGFCTTFNNYKEKCSLGDCDPIETFKVRLNFSEQRKNNTIVEGLDWTKGKFQDGALVTLRELSDYGIDVRKFNIVVGSENL